MALNIGQDFVSEHRRRHGNRPPEQRQLTYEIAVEDEYAPWRHWLDDQLTLLPARDAAKLAAKMWLDENFWTVVFELATGAGLRAVGLDVAYERAWDRVTPDWTVLSDADQPLCFVEVHTDNPSRETYGQMRAWHGLVQRIKEIPVSVVLQLASSGGPAAPPDAGTAKKIARELKTELMRESTRAHFTSCGYTFVVMGDSRRGGRQMASPLGPHTCFAPPSSRAGVVSARQLAERVQDKVRKYRELAESYQVPLVIAVGAHRFTGVTLKDLDELMVGSAAPTVTFQFGASDPWIGERTVNWEEVAPWVMPEDLAGLLWMDNRLPFGLTPRPNPRAHRPLPQALSASSCHG